MYRRNRLAAGVLTILLFMLTAGQTDAQISKIWGSLKPGAYSVGFKTIEKYDYSRTYRAKKDYYGNFREGERARPNQICIWYPAVKGEGELSMVYGEYTFAYPGDDSFTQFLLSLQNRENFFLQDMFGNNPGAVPNAINVKFNAVKDARAVDSIFPLIIYHPNWRNSYCENALLCEYLASHGYIVATSHCYDAADMNTQWDLGSAETITRDKEFILSVLRDEKNIDFDHLGLLGYNGGGISALLMQMRNGDVDAVATLDGVFLNPEYSHLLSDHLSYNPGKMIVPHLMIYTDGDSIHSSGLSDSLVYSDLYSFQLTGTDYGDFSQYRALGASMGEISPEDAIHNNRVYQTTCEYVMSFFDGYLKGDSSALAMLDSAVENNRQADFMAASFTRGKEVPPTQTQFLLILQTRGVTEALSLYEKFRETEQSFIPFSEAVGNSLGYQSLQRGQTEDALNVFKINAELYPGSANVWDSYADACIAANQMDIALECYKKVLEVLPDDDVTSQPTKDVIRANAERFISEAEQGRDESN